MQLQLLGQVAALVDGVAIDLARPMEAAVLAALATNPNRVVSRERLIDTLWGEEPPASAPKSLQSHVMRVRKLLDAAGAGDPIETVEGGYRLVLDTDAIDATRFEEAVAAGRAALDRGDSAASAALLTEALELWRGDALSPVTAPGLDTYRIRLEELHRQAFELYAEAKLAAGEHERLIGELQDAVRTDPYRERLWAMLILSLYRSGRQADALAEFARVRNLLLEELGVDPGQELRDLEVQILNQDADLNRSDHPTEGHAMPPVLESEVDRLFVGRLDELAAALDAINAAASGRRSLVLVTGEAGIGKSVFTSQVARAALDTGCRILYGRCDEQISAPYQPFVHALRSYANETEAPALGDYAAELTKLVPELDSAGMAPVQSDPETERLRLFDAALSWLRTVASQTPIVMVIEDLHWAGTPSLLLLRHLIRELVAEPITIIANFRPHGVTDEQGLESFLVEASRQAGTVELELRGLNQAEVVEILEQTGNQEVESISTRLLAASGGNPLYVTELADHMRSGGSLPSDGGDVPTGVRRTVDARLRELSEEATEVIEMAALVGQVFRFDVMRMAFGGIDVDGPLLQAVSAGLVVELPGRGLEYRFAHALTRLAISARLSEAARARLHRKIGRALEAMPTAPMSEMARHFRAAVALGEQERALEYTVASAQEALSQYADDLAGELFAAAQDLSPDPVAETEILIGLGEAQRRLGSPQYRETLLAAYESAALAHDGPRMAQALLTGYRGTFSRALQVDRAMVNRLAAAADHLEGDSSLRAQVLANHAVELAWDLDWQLAKSLSDEAVATARRLGDDATLARVLALRHWTVYDSLDDRLATTNELDALLARLPDPALQFEAAGMATFTYSRLGDHAAAQRRLHEAEALAEQLDRPPEHWMLMIRQFAAAMRDARFADAEKYCNAALALGQETGQPDAVTQFGVQQFWLACDRQERSAGVEMMTALMHNFERTWPLGWPSFAYRCSELGMRDEAERLVTTFDGLGLVDGLPRDQIWTFNLSALATTAAFLEDVDLAAKVLRSLTPASGQLTNSVFVSLGAVDRYLALAATATGDLDQAAIWFETAAETNRSLPAWRARTLLDWAALQHQIGDRDPASMIAEAADIAGSLGLPVIAERAAQLAGS